MEQLSRLEIFECSSKFGSNSILKSSGSFVNMAKVSLEIFLLLCFRLTRSAAHTAVAHALPVPSRARRTANHLARLAKLLAVSTFHPCL